MIMIQMKYVRESEGCPLYPDGPSPVEGPSDTATLRVQTRGLLNPGGFTDDEWAQMCTVVRVWLMNKQSSTPISS